MLHFIFVVIVVVTLLILSLPLLPIVWLIGKKNPARKDRISQIIVRIFFRCVAFCSGTKTVVKGLENIPSDTAVLYVGNHRSFFDIVLTYYLFPGITGYVAKIETRKWPILSLWMENIHCLFLDRDNIKEGLKTILIGIEKVKSGISMCIFPEGTRNKVNDTFLPFHDGSFKIADKGGVPVIPITIVNSADVFEDHFPKIKRTTVVIDFGKPIYISQLEKEQKKSLGSYFCGIISDRYFELKEGYFKNK